MVCSLVPYWSAWVRWIARPVAAQNAFQSSPSLASTSSVHTYRQAVMAPRISAEPTRTATVRITAQ